MITQALAVNYDAFGLSLEEKDRFNEGIKSTYSAE